ncbi:UDP-N-acetylmuramoyl-L-alanine--D-glutamate ligase [Rickettsia endosymbiont of Nabis limbatus]|uniref:UDP-N-acetylmuramoyl-L-alanine--D-glutamate ligase n=1 Tax=Rickettsia endosymbiont of Nabis limbatus TaxID=3066268 RepID=UPI003AF3EA4E
MTIHKKQNIGVFGLGKTGISVYEELQSKCNIIVYDDLEANRDKFEGLFGKNYIIPISDIKWQNLDKIALSPGIPLTHEIVKIAKNFNIPITSDIDLFFEKSKNLNLIAVTGTNGKSTTTALISHILNNNGLEYPIAGNIGVPALQAKASKGGYVLELSSFQLDLVKTFVTKIAVLLNITPDHQDRHENMESYIAAKSKIFDRMEKNSYGIINIDNNYCHEIFTNLQQKPHIKLIPFSVTKILEKGISIVNNTITDNFFEHISFKLLFNKSLQGVHNSENIAASYAVARIIGLKTAQILESISNFQGLPHRMQYLGSIDSINFYNDSKATNAIAAVQSIKALDNIYWLAGGIAKEGGIEEIKPYFSKIKKAYFYGQAKEMFANTAKDVIDFVICDDLKQAFELAYKDALNDNESIKNILLAPCCSSYDQFKNFEERGNLFVKLCNEKIGKN